MKTLEQIKTDDDLLDYIEGCLNDLEAGISTKDETHRHLADLVLFVAKKGWSLFVNNGNEIKEP